MTRRGPISLQASCAVGFATATMALGILGLTVLEAWPHKAPTGWAFDSRCCGNGDCYPVQTDAISERPDGYHIQSTGEVIPYQSYKVLPSPDGLAYRCSTAGKPNGITYCIYMPKGGV